MYDAIYGFYNRVMSKECDYDKWAGYILRLVGKGASGVELGCGTGLITYKMAAAGKKLVAVDLSEEMLFVAESKKKSSPCSPCFVCADMRKFTFPSGIDFVFSACDGLNYVSGEELPRLMKRIYACLKTGGIFTFDVSSEYKLRKIIGDKVFYIEDGNEVCLWVNKPENDRVRMELTLFTREKDGRYARTSEKQTQFVHKEEFLMNCMKEAGFSDVRITDFLSDERKIPRRKDCRYGESKRADGESDC